jgi:hypothetical protein
VASSGRVYESGQRVGGSMKLDRRKFIKGIGAALAMAVVPILPKIPEIPVDDTEVPIGKQNGIMQEYPCKDYNCQVTIQDYSPGETIKYQDLSGDGCCDTCMYENRCLQSGTKYERYGADAQGRWVPELWNKKLQNKWYRKFMADLKNDRRAKW